MTTIPDDMVERVARAILKARFYDCEPELYGNDVGAFFAVIDSNPVRDAEYEACAAIEAMQPAILAERERVATHLFDRVAFMTAVSGNGDPHVKIQFKTLKKMQSFYLALCELSHSAIRSQS